MFRLSKVPTPAGIFDSTESPTLHDIGQRLNAELSNEGAWNERCTEIFKESLTALFHYDRMECSMMRAYGSEFKILLNPMMVVCYHPTCLAKKKPPIRLKRILHLDPYLNHLKDHSDAIGTAMQLRFNAVVQDAFVTTQHLDAISPSPHSLNDITSLANAEDSICSKSYESINKFGIDRMFHVNYTCHWLDKLIKSGIVRTDSIVFQEMDVYVRVLCAYVSKSCY